MLMAMRDPNLEIRLQRARSWISLADALAEKSVGETTFHDGESTKTQTRSHIRFICYWIAFNCMHGLSPIDPDNLDKEPDSQMKEIDKFLARIKTMSRIDRERQTCVLEKAIHKCQSDAKKLIEDPFLSRKYWEGIESPGKIKSGCEADWKHVGEQLEKNRNFESLLYLTFFRLTVLRNQIIHGSATASHESKGYQSLLTGERFLQSMVPALLELVGKYGDEFSKWPKAPFPRIRHPEHPHLA